MNRIILTVIGGGSVNWMPALMKDVYMTDEIEGGEIRLVDPDTENTEAVKEMLVTFNRLRNKDYKISIVQDRRAALEGADFVLCTMSPGAMDGFYNDLEIPIKYGIIQPVSMTVGPCGISATLRTAPVAYEIVREMEEVCPGAWILNVTNPMSTTIKAMNLAAKTTRVIGMCHEFHALPIFLEHILGIKRPEGMDVPEFLYSWLPQQGFDYTVAGVNHFIWLVKAVYKGEDMLPIICEYCRQHVELDPSAVPGLNPFSNRAAAKFALCRQFGYLPLAGDRHLIEFYPSLCNIRNGFGMKYNVRKTTVDHRRAIKKEQLDYIRRVAREEASVTWKRSGEEMVSILSAVASDRSVTAIINAPNAGQISNMPEGRIVETFAQVSKKEIKPVYSGELPGAIGSLCRLHSDIHELTVKAALEGNRQLLTEALSLDPMSGGADFSELPQLAEELLEANKNFLPRFFI